MEEIEDEIKYLLMTYPFERLSSKKKRILKKKYRREYRRKQKKLMEDLCREKQKTLENADFPEWVIIDGGLR
jgi:hypothetical protein